MPLLTCGLMSTWRLFVDESGTPTNSTYVVGGLLVEGELTAEAERLMTALLRSQLRQLPYPPHQWLLNSASGWLFCYMAENKKGKLTERAKQLLTTALPRTTTPRGKDVAHKFLELVSQAGDEPRQEPPPDLLHQVEALLRGTEQGTQIFLDAKKQASEARQAIAKVLSALRFAYKAWLVASVGRGSDARPVPYLTLLDGVLERAIALMCAHDENPCCNADVAFLMLQSTPEQGGEKVPLTVRQVKASFQRACEAVQPVRKVRFGEVKVVNMDTNVHPGVALADAITHRMRNTLKRPNTMNFAWPQLAHQIQSALALPVCYGAAPTKRDDAEASAASLALLDHHASRSWLWSGGTRPPSARTPRWAKEGNVASLAFLKGGLHG